MICNSLYGELKETEQGSLREYKATFIADSLDHQDRLEAAGSERPARRLISEDQSVLQRQD